MSDIAISVDRISKAYRIGLKAAIPTTLAAAAKGWLTAPLRNLKGLVSLNTFQGGEAEDLYWALRDVTFEVQQGDVVGVIGHNGAGKSTLLKILSRITRPTEGRAVIHGRVSSLLEVGTGFHPELSGRENVYMNGTILGMRKVEIDSKFDEIVAFSGIEKFLDTPIKRYSSGMKVRLAFAVAAHLEPEILIIDEVLAVGDQEFQNKCLGKMQAVAKDGRTVLFVSHNMSAVESLCSRAIILKDGRVTADGTPEQAITQYLKGMSPAGAGAVDLQDSVVQSVRIHASDGAESDCVMLGEDMLLSADLQSPEPLEDVALVFWINNSRAQRVVSCVSKHQSAQTIRLRAGTPTRITCRLHDVRLVPGRYTLDVALTSSGQSVAEHLRLLEFEVASRDLYGTGWLPHARNCVFLPDATWTVDLPAASSLAPTTPRMQK